MTVPLATSTYTFSRLTNGDADSTEAAVYTDVVTGVRGTTTFVTGYEIVRQGSVEQVDARILCDPVQDVSLSHSDRVTDEKTGEVWSISFVRQRQGLGLNHLVVGVNAQSGAKR